MTESLWEGDIFAGKYKVERVIGQGAMGMVVAARHLGLDEPVAIKVLLPEMLEMPGMVDRFIREARAAARIRGEHVVRVSDVDTLPSGVPFMVMERLEGMDLADLARSRGRLSVGEVARHVRQVCAALDDAHALGVVHRDIKPGNLFLARRRDGSSVVKVLDFGISKLSHGDHVATRAGTVLGSPAYMSPEQMTSAKDVDGRTDIWALGVVLFELLTGELPFQAESLPQLCTAILHLAPPRPSTKRPDLPPEIDAIVLRCLEKDRALRFESARALSLALAPFEGEAAPLYVGDRQSDVGVAAIASSAPGTSSAPALDSGARREIATVRLGSATEQTMSRSNASPPKRGLAMPAVGAVIAALSALGIFVATRSAPKPSGVVAAAGPSQAASEAPRADKPAATVADTVAAGRSAEAPAVTPSVVASEAASASAAPARLPVSTAAPAAEAPKARGPLPSPKATSAPAPTAAAAKPAPPPTATDPFSGDRK